jgi:hypothetical protein
MELTMQTPKILVFCFLLAANFSCKKSEPSRKRATTQQEADAKTNTDSQTVPSKEEASAAAAKYGVAEELFGTWRMIPEKDAEIPEGAYMEYEFGTDGTFTTSMAHDGGLTYSCQNTFKSNGDGAGEAKKFVTTTIKVIKDVGDDPSCVIGDIGYGLYELHGGGKARMVLWASEIDDFSAGDTTGATFGFEFVKQ